MSIPNLHEASLLRAQMRAVTVKLGKPYSSGLPTPSVIAALAKHGGMYTLLDRDMMNARLAALLPSPEAQAPVADLPPAAMTMDGLALVTKLQEMAANFFYKLVDQKGYLIHSELMAYIAEPGKGNGVAFDEGLEDSPIIPAAFTFVGQFIDHDLTFNGMDLTSDQTGAIFPDEASPIIDLDSVYGPRKKGQGVDMIFNPDGTFQLRAIENGYDLPRHTDEMIPDTFPAAIFDPRNDENQMILQVHLLVQRFHNALIKSGCLRSLQGITDRDEIIDRVRKEVVATWQSFILHEYLPAITRPEVLQHVIEQVHVKATDPSKPEQQYGDLKHKPQKDLTTGRNIVRMPHEFAIGFRFGHSQLRPFYLLRKDSVVLLFKDAHASHEVTVEGVKIKVSGKDDLRGGRHLSPNHVIDWDVFFPTKSQLIDHKVTARVFSLPESAIPDDIKFIGNLVHRNLIRSSQIGIVCGEDLAGFYGLPKSDTLSPEEVLGSEAEGTDAGNLFKLDHLPMEEARFQTPLWYYLLKEAEVQNEGKCLGKLGSRLVSEVLAGAIYYGNEFAFNDEWTSAAITPAKPKSIGSIAYKDSILLHDIIDFVKKVESSLGSNSKAVETDARTGVKMD